MRRIIKYATYCEVEDYELGECPKLEGMLSKYNKLYYRREAVAMDYDEESSTLTIPAGMNLKYISYLLGRPVDDNTITNTYDSVSIKLTGFPRSELQNDLIKFLIGLDQYQFNGNMTQLVGNAETGEGKTFCAIAAISFLSMKTIIIVNRKNIVKNWIDSIDTYTDLDRRRICELNTRMIEKIMDDPSIVKKYRVFVTTHRTIASNAAKYGWNWIRCLFANLRVGLKIYDEAHMEFHNMMMIDFHSNVRRTFYLTANMERSSYDENSIFQKCFKAVPRFDQVKLGYTDSKKHITMFVNRYNSHPSVQEISACKNVQGFNKNAYSDYQVTSDTQFFEILDQYVRRMTVEKGFRTLILVSKITSCEAVKEFFASIYPGLSIGVYNSSIDKHEKQRVLDEDQLIVSTSASLGFSETIANLRLVINCEAFRSKITGNQASGRLRRLGDDIMCYYVELVDTGFASIRAQFKERESRYKKQFKEIIYIK